MRHPLLRAIFWLGTALLGVVLLLLAKVLHSEFGRTAGAVSVIAGLVVTGLGVVLLLRVLSPAIGEARLRLGKGVIARWFVPPEEWARFRGYDAARAAERPHTVNMLLPRPGVKQRPTRVIFGRESAVVDGAYYLLQRFKMPELRGVGWLKPQGAPECLEFDLVLPRGTLVGPRHGNMRVPVPQEARAKGQEVLAHFRGTHLITEDLAPGRGPLLALAVGVVMVLLGIAMAGTGYLLAARHGGGLLTTALTLIGAIGSLTATLFTLIVAVTAIPWGHRD